MSLGKELCKRQTKLRSDRGLWESRWQDCATYCRGGDDEVYTWLNKTGGDQKRIRLYNSIGEESAEILASNLHSMLTNSMLLWFALSTGDVKLDRVTRIRKYLQKTSNKAHEILNGSNFVTEIHEVYLDLVTFGTAPMRIEEDDETLIRFHAHRAYEIDIDENHKKEIDTVFITYKMTVRSAFKKYGADVFGRFKDDLAKDMDESIEILHAVFPREDASSRKDKNFAKKKAFASIHIYKEKELVIKEGGFDDFPWVVPRWIKNTTEKWGRSPAMKGMPEIKLCNQMDKTTIRSAQKVVDPSLMVPDDGYMGRVNTAPGGLNPYRAGTQDRIYPLETGSNPGLGMDIIAAKEDKVKKAFYLDQLQLRDGPQMTATEVQTHNNNQLRTMGPIAGRLNPELLKPIIGRVLAIMVKKNLMPEDMPEELEGMIPKVIYTSQMARAQKQSQIQVLDAYVSKIAQASALDSTVMDLIDLDSYAMVVAELDNVSGEIFREDKDLKEFRAQKEEEGVRQQQIEESVSSSQAAKNSADAVNKLRE